MNDGMAKNLIDAANRHDATAKPTIAAVLRSLADYLDLRAIDFGTVVAERGYKDRYLTGYLDSTTDNAIGFRNLAAEVEAFKESA